MDEPMTAPQSPQDGRPFASYVIVTINKASVGHFAPQTGYLNVFGSNSFFMSSDYCVVGTMSCLL